MLISEILLRAKYTLRPCRWSKNISYIERGPNHIKVLPYINVQLIHNPKSINFLDLNSISLPSAAFFTYMMQEAVDGHHFFTKNNQDVLKTLETRANYFHDSKLEPHYILGMAGLTKQFNSLASTSFQDLLDKFDQAIDIAQTLKV